MPQFLSPFCSQDHSDDFDAESEDAIPTSPGTILHYFACLNYLEGVHTLLHDERYRVFHSRLNKNGLTPLWIASWYNNVRIGVLGRNAIDIFLGPESGPEPCPSHFCSFETYLNL